MEPLVTLVVVTGLLLLAGALGAMRLRRPTNALRGGLAAMFALTAGAHFVGMRDELVAMVPPALPAPGLLVTLTGIAEFTCALGLLWSRTARLSAGVLSAMLVVMFPANVHAATGDVPWYDELGPGPPRRPCSWQPPSPYWPATAGQQRRPLRFAHSAPAPATTAGPRPNTAAIRNPDPRQITLPDVIQFGESVVAGECPSNARAASK
ncbi:hypothetical protein WKI71_44560 [Streptomyces sp. MS1.AVA.1]|uniref:DoxX family membrane protein n=1 Tax=Streptomyces machairae TaxID=3134109 RepID=A0ABU8UVE5_9ACTN